MSAPTDTPPRPWPPGYALNPREDGPAAEWIERFGEIPTSWISDNLGRSVGGVGLIAYHDDLGLMVAGTAVTVRVRPGDNLMIHKALEVARRGDVIVIDGGGDLSQAVIGGNMRATALHKGIAAFVVDGAVRDLTDWAKGGVGVWSRGHTHRGPSKDGPGEVNVQIACAGMVVNPGDLIVGDADGVVAIPSGAVEALWPLVLKQGEREARLVEANASGAGDPERFDAILRAKGCPV